MGNAVGNDEIARVEHHVVAHYLVKRLAGNRYVRRFILDNHPWSTATVKDYRIASATRVIERQRYLVTHETCWITVVIDEKSREVLTHPFLWRKGDITAPQRIKDLPVTVGYLYRKINRWKI